MLRKVKYLQQLCKHIYKQPPKRATYISSSSNQNRGQQLPKHIQNIFKLLQLLFGLQSCYVATREGNKLLLCYEVTKCYLSRDTGLLLRGDTLLPRVEKYITTNENKNCTYVRGYNLFPRRSSKPTPVYITFLHRASPFLFTLLTSTHLLLKGGP